MRLPLVLAVAAAESEAPTWRLTDSPTSQDWHTAKGRYCGKHLPLPTANETVNYHACSSKCGPDSYCSGDAAAPCFCSGYLPEYDHDGGSDALCVPQDLCREMCERNPACAGIEVTKDQGLSTRCFLVPFTCMPLAATDQLLHHPDWKFQWREEVVDAECPLGTGLMVTHADLSASGMYNLVDGQVASGVFQQSGVAPGHGPGARVAWKHGCGWALEVPVYASPAARRLGGCQDHELAAKVALGAGHGGACELANAWRAEACQHALFAALCPRTCARSSPHATCEGDHAAAARQYGALLGLEVSECGDLAAKGQCDMVVRKFCPVACQGLRSPKGTDKAVVGPFRQALRHQPVDKERQLRGAPDHYFTAYRTFQQDQDSCTYPVTLYDPLPDTNVTCNTSHPDCNQTEFNWSNYTRGFTVIDVQFEPNTTAFEGGMVDKYVQAQQTGKIGYDCPDREVFETESHRYCPHNNIDDALLRRFTHDPAKSTGGAGMAPGAQGLSDGFHERYSFAGLTAQEVQDVSQYVHDNLCGKKCVRHKDGSGRPAYGADTLQHLPLAELGAGECEGAGEVEDDASALCLTRSACEEVCSRLMGICSSVDMSTVAPRCWLNGPHCAGDWELPVFREMDHLAKRQTRAPAFTYETAECLGDTSHFPHVFNETHANITNSSNATFKLSYIFELGRTTEECEHRCLHEPGCVGFELHTHEVTRETKCYYFNHTGSCPRNGTNASEHSLEWYDYPYTWGHYKNDTAGCRECAHTGPSSWHRQIATRAPVPTCRVHLDGAELLPTASGSDGGFGFVAKDHSERVVLSPSGDHTRGCGGWSVESNGHPAYEADFCIGSNAPQPAQVAAGVSCDELPEWECHLGINRYLCVEKCVQMQTFTDVHGTAVESRFPTPCSHVRDEGAMEYRVTILFDAWIEQQMLSAAVNGTEVPTGCGNLTSVGCDAVLGFLCPESAECQAGLFPGPDLEPAARGFVRELQHDDWAPKSNTWSYIAETEWAAEHWVTGRGNSLTLEAGHCAETCKDDADFRDEYGYTCQDWAVDCDVANLLNSTDCETTYTQPGPDGSVCEDGGLVSYGFFYSAAFMQALHAACPVSCHAYAHCSGHFATAAHLLASPAIELLGTLEDLQPVFPALAPESAVGLELQCRQRVPCPAMTSCVVRDIDWELQLGLLDEAKYGVIADRSQADREAALMSQDWEDMKKYSQKDGWPKIVVAEERATAALRVDPGWGFGMDLWRAVPAASRFRVTKVPPAAHTLVATVEDSVMHGAALGAHPPAGYSAWATDILRLELFDHEARPLPSAHVSAEVFVPGLQRLKLYHIETQLLSDIVPDHQSEKTGWYDFSVELGPRGTGHFVVVYDLDECAAGTHDCEAPEDGGSCTNLEGSYECSCLSGFSELLFPGARTQCIRDAASLAVGVSVVVYPLEVKDGQGWRLTEIEAYGAASANGTCVGPKIPSPWQSVEAADTFPGFDPAALTDGLDGTAWWSKCRTCERSGGEGAWVRAHTMDLKVECLRVKADCELPGYLVARSGLGDHRVGLADVAGHAGWTHTTVHAASGQQVDLPILCGIQDHAYHGEKLIEYDNVLSNCQCKQLCTDQIDEGCEAWKWYRERHVCQLLRSVFEVAGQEQPRTDHLRDPSLPTGWWRGLREAKGWVSGIAATRLTSATYSKQTGILALTGVGLPVENTHAQTVKILEADQHCVTGMPPETVDGNACSNWFTCSPRPASSSRTHVEFAGLSFAAAHAETKYKACWCAVDCAIAEHWHEVALSSVVEHAGFSWLAGAQPASFGTTEIRVARQPFTSFTHATDWRLRFVRPDLSCQFRTAAAICVSTGADCGPPRETTLDEAVWDVEIEFDVRGGAYKVCVSEDGHDYVEVPSKDSRYFLITARFSAAERLYQQQYFSGKAGHKVALFAQGSLALPTQAKLGLADLDQGCGGNATLLGTLLPGQTPKGELIFEADLADLPHIVAGEYAVCFCDALKDAQDGGLEGDATSTYVVEPFVQVLDSPAAVQNSPDQCERKCGQGCLGPKCYCDDYFDAKRAAAAGSAQGGTAVQEQSFQDVLCLPHAACRELCEFMGAECGAYSVDRGGLNLCWISGADATRDQQRGVQTDTWTKRTGEACTGHGDFFPGSRVGTLAVTERVDLQVDYVVPPDSLVSLEISGSDLSAFTDRIIVVPGYERCGVAQPIAEGVESPEGVISQLAPKSFFVDPGAEPAGENGPALHSIWRNAVEAATYSRNENLYCKGYNIEPDSGHILLEAHRCVSKCDVEDPPMPECAGYMPGFDKPNDDRSGERSAALCLAEVDCKALCDLHPSCDAIDMHRDLPRCYLNGPLPLLDNCPTRVASDQYDLLVRDPEANDRRLKSRKLQQRLVETVDMSTQSVLRFPQMKFAAGSYKLCFCDVDAQRTHGAGVECRQPSDFTLEVGQVHASGISCLLDAPQGDKYAAMSPACVHMEQGGVRCYRSEQAALARDPDLSSELWGLPSTDQVAMLAAFCAFADASEATYTLCSRFPQPTLAMPVPVQP